MVLCPEEWRTVVHGYSLYDSEKEALGHSDIGKMQSSRIKTFVCNKYVEYGAELNAVKELLGHSSLASTSIYTHTTFEELKKVYHAHPRAQKEGGLL